MTEHDEIVALEKRVRELEGWAREQSGQSTERWVAQVRENEQCEIDRQRLRDHIDEKFGLVFKKLNSLETKVASFAAAAALVGAAASKYLLP